jgi:hypothetical protein
MDQLSVQDRQNPETVVILDAIPRAQIPAAIARLAARLLQEPPPLARQPPTESDDAILTPVEVATFLKTDRRWVYRNGKALGAIRLSRRKLRFSARRIQRFLKRQRTV